MLDLWNPAYLEKPLLDGSGDSNHADQAGQLERADMSSAVKSALGADSAEVTSETKEGGFTITP